MSTSGLIDPWVAVFRLTTYPCRVATEWGSNGVGGGWGGVQTRGGGWVGLGGGVKQGWPRGVSTRREAPLTMCSLGGGTSASAAAPVMRSQDAAPVTLDLENCSICLEPLDPRGEHRAVQLRCGHVFGSQCIGEWLQTDKKQRRCPQCQTKVDKHSQRDLCPILGLRVQDGGDEAQLTGTLEAVRSKRQRLERSNEKLQRDHDQMVRQRDLLLARVRAAAATAASATAATEAAAAAAATEAAAAAAATAAAAAAATTAATVAAAAAAAPATEAAASQRSEDGAGQLSLPQQARMLANREAALARLQAAQPKV